MIGYEPCLATACRWARSVRRGLATSAESAGDVKHLWGPAPGAGARAEKQLAKALWSRIKAHNEVHLEARGSSSVAGSLRALGWASKDGSSAVEFSTPRPWLKKCMFSVESLDFS